MYQLVYDNHILTKPKQFLEMDQKQTHQTLLASQVQSNINLNNRAKIAYLQQQKYRLETIVNQVMQNNQHLRTINKMIFDEKMGSSEIYRLLNLQNVALQESYVRILKQNQHLLSQLLISRQIMDENTIQFNAILQNYQDKIVEIRKAISMKEARIQQLQQKVLSNPPIYVPLTDASKMFFQQIQQLKKIIDRLTLKNKDLQKQNQCLVTKSENIQKKINLIQSLTFHSKVMFQEFKHFYCIKKRQNSAPKHKIWIPLDCSSTIPQKALKNNKTNDSLHQQCSINTANGPLKMLFYKKYLQVDHLKSLYYLLKVKYQSQLQTKNKVINSYKLLQNINANLTKQLNYYKDKTNDLIKLLYFRKHNRCRSSDKLKSQTFQNQVVLPKQKQLVQQRKLFWQQIAKKLTLLNFNIIQIKNKHRKIKRSLSCVVDYRITKIEQTQKQLNKKSIWPKVSKLKNDSYVEMGDISIDINDCEDISIINYPSHAPSPFYCENCGRSTKFLDITISQNDIL